MTSKYLKPACVLLVSSIFSQLSFSQSDSARTGDYMVDTMTPVEITGIRAHQIAPFSFSNLYQHEFRKYQTGQDLAYTLEALPSVVSNSDAGNGIGYTDIRVRGTDMQRINFTLNGIPLNDAESHSTFFVNMPDLLSSTQSIQIQRGVGSSTNGPSSFGASVNLSNTNAPSDPYIETSHSAGSFNTFKNTVAIGTGRLNNGFYSSIRLSKISSDGYIERAGSELSSLHVLSGWDSDDSKTSLKFNLLLGKEKTGQAWNGVSEDRLSTNRRFNELGMMDNGAYYDDQTDNYQQHYYQLFLQHHFNESWTANAGLFLTRGYGYYNEYKIGESYSDYFLPDFRMDSVVRSETSLIRQLWLDNYLYGSVFNVQYSSGNTVINSGGSVSSFDNKHYGIVKWAQQGIEADHRWYNNKADKSDINIYSKWTQKLSPHFYSYIDLQARAVSYNIYGFRKSPDIVQENSYIFFNPKAGITYTSGSQKAFASFGMANKEPNRDDFEASVLETPSHETLYDFELGYEIKNHVYSLNIQAYYMQYKNQLINTGKINDVGAYTRTNVDNSFRRGIELSGLYRILPRLSINGHLTLSQNKIRNFEEFIDDFDNGGQVIHHHPLTDISLSPGVIAFVQISSRPLMSLPGFQWDLSGRYISRQYLDNTSSLSRSIEPYFLINSIFQYDFKIRNAARFTAGLTIQNVLGTEYVSKGYTFSYISDGMNTFNYFFPQAGRQFFLTLSMKL